MLEVGDLVRHIHWGIIGVVLSTRENGLGSSVEVYRVKAQDTVWLYSSNLEALCKSET